MRAVNRFQRDFLVKLEESIRAQITASAAQQWLGLRLQILGAFLVGGSGFIAVITSAADTSPEQTGLVISYALSIVTLLSGFLGALTETEQVNVICEAHIVSTVQTSNIYFPSEQELIAVERVNSYSRLKPEVNADGSRDPPFGWPCQGVIKFDNVSLKYRYVLSKN